MVVTWTISARYVQNGYRTLVAVFKTLIVLRPILGKTSNAFLRVVRVARATGCNRSCNEGGGSYTWEQAVDATEPSCYYDILLQPSV